jgi:predicted Zn-dependent protease
MHAFGAATLVALLASACVVPDSGGPGGAGYPGDAEVQREYQTLRQRSQSRFLEQKERVERVGRRLLETMPDHPRVQFVIVRGNPDINAGATFGQVAITSGMLDFIRSDDEMAAVLGHELAHITQGHVTKGVMSSLALNVLAIVLETRAPGAGRAAGGIGQLFLNHYTQTQEREADTVGLRYAYGAGYDPRAAVDVMERMAVEVPQTMSAGFFNTHPSSVERAVADKQLAEELLAQGKPPGRAEALALERRGSPMDRRSRSHGRTDDELEGEPPSSFESDAVPEAREGREATSEECRRAQTYLDRARDTRDPHEKDELHRRALRFCPSLAEARDSGSQGRPSDEELDRY